MWSWVGHKGNPRWLWHATVEVDTTGLHLVTFPDVPEAGTDAKTREEALLGATDTLIAALGGYLEAKRALPPVLKAQPDQVLLVLPLLTNLRRQIYLLKHLLSCQFQPL